MNSRENFYSKWDSTHGQIFSAVQLIFPGSVPTMVDEIKDFEKTAIFFKETWEQGMMFKPLSMRTNKNVVSTDDYFLKARGLQSLLCFIILMVVEFGNEILVHYGSNRCKLIASWVTSAEFHAIVKGFYF